MPVSMTIKSHGFACSPDRGICQVGVIREQAAQPFQNIRFGHRCEDTELQIRRVVGLKHRVVEDQPAYDGVVEYPPAPTGTNEIRFCDDNASIAIP